MSPANVVISPWSADFSSDFGIYNLTINPGIGIISVRRGGIAYEDDEDELVLELLLLEV